VGFSHMQLQHPLPRGDPSGAAGPADYNLNAPMASTAMCKGKPPGAPQATFHAGEVIPVTFKGSARHGGGLCQFALSYDDDHSFHVIQSIKGACPDCKRKPYI
jgi:hypothetical protein